MKTITGIQTFARAALICISCDIPATSKVSEFVGQNAFRAGSRCLKSFPTEAIGERADFTGCDRSSCEPRSIHTHRVFF